MARTRAEIGAPGLPIFAGRVNMDPNVRLRGRDKIRILREMAYDEPAASAFLAACKHLLRTDVQVQPSGSTEPDKRAAAFLGECLDDMRDSLAQQIRQIYSMLWAGYDIAELVYKRRTPGLSKYPDGRIGWAAWAHRRQESFERWEWDDKRQRVTGWTQRPAPDYALRSIPLMKAIHVTADDAEGDPEGMSLIRPMYRQWFFCKNVELLMGISLERFGTGIPVFSQSEENRTQLDPNSTEFQTLEDIAASVRQNEEAFVIEPWGWRFRFEPSPGLDAEVFLKAIQRYRLYMLQTVLADFIMLGSEGGAYALGKDKTELFLLALNGIQDRLLDALNRQAVTRLIRYNRDSFGGALTAPPVLTLPAIRRYDLQALAGFAEILSRIGTFHPTPEDEALFRKISDLPDVPLESLAPLYGTPPQIDTDEDDDGETDEPPDTEELPDDAAHEASSGDAMEDEGKPAMSEREGDE